MQQALVNKRSPVLVMNFNILNVHQQQCCYECLNGKRSKHPWLLVSVWLTHAKHIQINDDA